MDPYRSTSHEETAEAPSDRGIVGDVIAQFADPSAFYRELVQNAIDAGTPSVDVRLEYDPSAQVMRASVRDRGEGMTRDVIENQLLVLFRSTKEKDASKIGKFGIGFASVLSPNPDVVAVHTARDGHRLTLHLQRDLTYRLFDAGPATQAGTTVELDITVPPDRVAAFVQQSEAALVRWCRHATVPIELAVHLPGVAPRTARIDRPLGLEDALVSVEERDSSGQLVVTVGITPGAAASVGFFNHGLMLFETTEPLLGRLAVKIQDSRLGHTLSRDDVRRDAAFDRALDFARSLAERRLPVAATHAIAEAAQRGDLPGHQALVDAVVASGVQPSAWWFPLVEPVGGRTAIDASALGRTVWASSGRGSLATAFAATGTPVLRTTDLPWLAMRVQNLTRCTVLVVEHELTRVTPTEPSEPDAALLALLEDVFAKVHRAPASIVLARLDGACGDALAVAGLAGSAPYFLNREQAAGKPFGRLRRPPLVVSADHAFVHAARDVARGDRRVAASHLARAILLGYQLLDVDRSAAMLDHALDQLAIGGRE